MSARGGESVGDQGFMEGRTQRKKGFGGVLEKQKKKRG